jgi:TolB protein
MYRYLLILNAFMVPLLVPAAPDDKPADPPAVVRLTKDGGFKQHLSWSPDGKRFLMTRIHEGKMALWTMNADGTDLKLLLAPPPNQVHFDGHWSPDSKKIVFVLDTLQGTDGKLAIHTVNADGSDSKVVVPNKAFEESPRWSPDGKSIAWVSTRDGNQ